MKKWVVVVRRSNGRFVRTYPGGHSHYSAKKAMQRLEEKYDSTYLLEIKHD